MVFGTVWPPMAARDAGGAGGRSGGRSSGRPLTMPATSVPELLATELADLLWLAVPAAIGWSLRWITWAARSIVRVWNP